MMYGKKQRPVAKNLILSFTVFLNLLFWANSVWAGDMDRELIEAAQQGELKKTIALLDKNANVNAQDKEGRTALMLAAGRSTVKKVKLLLERGAEMKARDQKGETALMFAVKENSAEVVEMLLDYGANVNARNNNGRTPLALALEGGHEKVFVILKKHQGKL